MEEKYKKLRIKISRINQDTTDVKLKPDSELKFKATPFTYALQHMLLSIMYREPKAASHATNVNYRSCKHSITTTHPAHIGFLLQILARKDIQPMIFRNTELNKKRVVRVWFSPFMMYYNQCTLDNVSDYDDLLLTFTFEEPPFKPISPSADLHNIKWVNYDTSKIRKLDKW